MSRFPHQRGRALDALAFLTPRQYHKMVGYPDMILQFAHYLAALMREKGRPDVGVQVIARAGLNGRQPSLLIDPDVNLAAIQRSLLRANLDSTAGEKPLKPSVVNSRAHLDWHVSN